MSPIWFAAAAALFALGLVVRLDHIGRPALDAAGYSSNAIVIRQYHSALLARAYYLDWRRSSSPADLRLASGIRSEEKLVEPPLLEGLVAGVYIASGGERLWLARLLDAIVWIAGAGFLIAVALRITSHAGALVGAAVYLLLPFSIVAGRSFQPDPVMVAALLLACLMAVRFGERPSGRRFAAAAASAAFATLLKPGWALFLLVPFFASTVNHYGRERIRHTVAYGAIAAAPAALWILYGEFVDTFLHGQANDKIQPRLLAQPDTYRGWLSMIGDVLDPRPRLAGHAPLTGLALLVAAIVVGLFAVRRAGWALVPLWAGYFLFGLAFATHIRNHNYYSLLLVPIVALTLAAAVPRLAGFRFGEASVAVAIVAGLVLSAAFLHKDLASPALARAGASYKAIGAAIGHRSAIVLGPYFGEPLEYHGRFEARWWPTGNDVGEGEPRLSVADRLAATNRTYWPAPAAMAEQPRYFIAGRADRRDEPALDRYLRTHTKIASIGDYDIFELAKTP